MSTGIDHTPSLDPSGARDVCGTIGRVDIHCHLLPGVDDGCKTLEDALVCARGLVAAGYTHCFCTPHIWPSLPDNNIAVLPGRICRLQRALDEANIPLRLVGGGELNMTDRTCRLAFEAAVTDGMRRRYVLIDLWADHLPSFFEKSIRHLQGMGLKVILAHPERMRAVQDNPALCDTFVGMGLLLQGNLGCLAEPPESPDRRTAERLLVEDRYFALGSDLHNSGGLEDRLRGLRRAVAVLGDLKVWQLTSTNPRQLLPRSLR